MSGIGDIVPTIDISVPTALGEQLPALDRACREHGLFLLAGHGLDDVVDRTWDAAAAFFASDRRVKLAV